MRSIDPVIKARLLQMQQTLYSNAQPAMDVHAIRPRTPIFHKRFWEESIITPDITATSTSVAIRKTGATADRAYVAYVSNGVLTVKSAAITFPVSQMIWQIELTISNCMACALEFDGRFIQAAYNKVEYRTDLVPWLFYVSDSGALMAGLLGGVYEPIVSGNVTALDAVRGIASLYKDIDQGLIVFYLYGGNTYYKQLINGVWLGQEAVEIAPPNAVAVKCERLFDYRIVLHISDASGVLWEVFTKMEASGWNGTEYISANLSVISELVPIEYLHFYGGTEYVTASVAVETKTLYALSPQMQSASNMDDGTGNYGLKVNLTWDENIFGETDHAGNFVISDSHNGAWGGQSLVKDKKVLTITFMDFNNAINPVTVTYTPGTMMGDVVAVESDSITFDAVGLIPTEIPVPVSLSAENIDAKQIIISFDDVVESANWAIAKAGFTVTALEYDMIPGGTASLKTYVVESAEYLTEVTEETMATSSASLANTTLSFGAIQLEPDI